MTANSTEFPPFVHRHIGPRQSEIQLMLKATGASSLEEFISKVVPINLASKSPLKLPYYDQGLTEEGATVRLRELAAKNKVLKSYLGMGYHGTITPAVIKRNILENPGWYTAYTPYQPEISQGRLEALLNFQTLVTELTGLDVANASMLDEGTAAAEGVALAHAVAERKGLIENPTVVVSVTCHPQTISILKTRADAVGLTVVVTDDCKKVLSSSAVAVVVQYPDTTGKIFDYSDLTAAAHTSGALVIAIADPMALVLLKPPGEWGADVAVGSMQRFGVPMGFGGPHAAYFATKTEYLRLMPGRLVGISKMRKENRHSA